MAFGGFMVEAVGTCLGVRRNGLREVLHGPDRGGRCEFWRVQ